MRINQWGTLLVLLLLFQALSGCTETTNPNNNTTGDITQDYESITLTPEGGNFEFYYDLIYLDFPENIVNEDTLIKVRSLESIPTQEDFIIQYAFSLEPENTSFPIPLTVRIHYSRSQLLGNTTPDDVHLYTYQNETWQILPDSYAYASQVQGEITKFCIIGVGYQYVE